MKNEVEIPQQFLSISALLLRLLWCDQNSPINFKGTFWARTV